MERIILNLVLVGREANVGEICSLFLVPVCTLVAAFWITMYLMYKTFQMLFIFTSSFCLFSRLSITVCALNMNACADPTLLTRIGQFAFLCFQTKHRCCYECVFVSFRQYICCLLFIQTICTFY